MYHIDLLLIPTDYLRSVIIAGHFCGAHGTKECNAEVSTDELSHETSLTLDRGEGLAVLAYRSLADRTSFSRERV
jgi:hypothetical protein